MTEAYRLCMLETFGQDFLMEGATIDSLLAISYYNNSISALELL
jgi:hypothetical protein